MQHANTKNNVLYLVTGATGFLGSTVCRQLLERNEHVRALVMPNDKAVQFLSSEIEVFEGNLCDPQSLAKFFAVPEETDLVVLHCASVVTVDPAYNPKVIDVNVGGTQNIVDQCLAHDNCKKLVYVSSTSAIPELPKGQIIQEVSQYVPYDPQKVLGCYSQSKAMATQIVLDAAREKNLNACVVFPSGILGPEDYAVGEITDTVIKIIEGKMPMGINGSFNLCDVRDLAHGVILAVDMGKAGECYILGNKEVSFRQFAQLLAQECGAKPIRFFLPIPVANFFAAQLEKQAKRKGTRPLMTTFSVYNLSRNNQFDSSKAKRELGYTTRSYQETLRDEAHWLKMMGKI